MASPRRPLQSAGAEAGARCAALMRMAVAAGRFARRTRTKRLAPEPSWRMTQRAQRAGVVVAAEPPTWALRLCFGAAVVAEHLDLRFQNDVVVKRAVRDRACLQP